MKLKMSEVKHFAFLLTHCVQILNVCYCEGRLFSYRLAFVWIKITTHTHTHTHTYLCISTLQFIYTFAYNLPSLCRVSQ